MISNVILSLGVLGAAGLMGSLNPGAAGPGAAPPDLPRLEAVLTQALRAELPFDPGGQVTVALGAPVVSRAGGRETLAFSSARIELAHIKLGPRLTGTVRLDVRGLELDHQKLLTGRLDCRGVPEVSSELVLEERALIGHLKSGRGRCKGLSFDGRSMTIDGRIAVGFLSIPFRVQGQPVLFGSTVGLRVESVLVSGNPAGSDRMRTAQAKLGSLIPLAGLLRPLGIPELRVSGGQLDIQRGGRSLFRRSLELADLAE